MICASRDACLGISPADRLRSPLGSIARLTAYLSAQSVSGARKQVRTTVHRLERTIDMRKQGAMSNTIALSGTVDLESNTKGQASRVDVAKLAKAEAKIKAKIEKRSRRDLFEGSKLIDAQKKQQSYEEMFMKVNPLQAPGAAKGKSKDIHLPSIDVSFASNRILCVGSRAGLASGLTELVLQVWRDPHARLRSSLWVSVGRVGGCDFTLTKLPAQCHRSQRYRKVHAVAASGPARGAHPAAYFRTVGR